MTKIDFVHHFEINFDEYLRLVFEPTEEEQNDLTDLPNVKEREEIERYEDDDVIRTKVRYFAIGFIPPKARKYLKPHMLSWVEHSTWDKAGKFWKWHIEPHFFKEIFDCRGKMSLHEAGQDRTKRVTKGHISVKVPVVGQMIEQIILKELDKNFKAEIKMFNDMLRRTGRRD